MRRVIRVLAFAAAAVTLGARAVPAAPNLQREGTAVTSLAIVPASGRADVVIAVGGPVEVLDFTLDSGRRVVIDLRGATLGIPARLYDMVRRAGITNVRFAQFRAEVVRVVLELDGPREYRVVKGERDVRVSVTGPDDFEPWRVGPIPQTVVTEVALAAAAPAASPPAAQPPAPPASGSAPAPASPAPATTPAQGAATSAPGRAERLVGLSGAPAQASQQPRISVTFEDMAIRDVITTFADFSQRTIVVGPQVQGTVTATITDVPWDVALRTILTTNNLAASEDSLGIITVDSYTNLAQRAQVEPLYTRVIAVNYTKAETMANTVRALLSAGCGAGGLPAGPPAAGAPPGAAAAAGTAVCGRGAVTHEEKTNSLIVTETQSRLDEIQSYIRDLDVRTAQVSIKAKIIAVDRTGTEQLGLSYDLGSENTFSNALVTRFQPGGTTPIPGDFRVNLGGDGIAAVANSQRQFKSTSSLGLIYNMSLGGFNLTSFLDALSSVQLTDVQAEPSVTTVDNKEATLFAGSEIGFLLTPPIVPGQVQSVAVQIQRQNIGITLRVTPHVTANRQVLLDIYTEQQQLVAITVAGPNVNKRNSTNQVLVGDGETAVIGGLTQTQVSRNRTGIPVLMDLPGIGRLFSQTDTTERKQDLLILITPHIVDEGEVVRRAP